MARPVGTFVNIAEPDLSAKRQFDAVPLDRPYHTAAGILEAVDLLLKEYGA